MSISCFWFRRDLRLEDNHGLHQALISGNPVLPVFIFDSTILDALQNPQDRRVQFIYDRLLEIDAKLRELGSGLLVRYGKPLEVWKEILRDFPVSAVYTNSDYEPYAQQRDSAVENLLKNHPASFYSFKDQVIFERNEVVKSDGKPYTVFTPYKNKWLSLFSENLLKPYPSENMEGRLFTGKIPGIFPLKKIGFTGADDAIFPERKISVSTIAVYDQNRDFPALPGTTRLSVHLRFGTLSIRKAVGVGYKHNAVWLSELIWREFYMMILAHFPHVAQASFKPEYDSIQWLNQEDQFQAWCEGRTGYPIVDAGMRELLATGFMHNRVRMIVASFLTKHLLIDWRWGEAWFARHLLDFDLSANNGGWQWAAGSGCDAAPYFRVFNPYIQTEKFDPKREYIRKWVPEFELPEYPKPIVDHAVARNRAIEVYQKALKNN
jgi:deoxyribodipyrimidine photo-lyase